MAKLSLEEHSQIMEINAQKAFYTQRIDRAINSLVDIRRAERLWWRAIVEKYKLEDNKRHLISLGGEIKLERRESLYGRKIF